MSVEKRLFLGIKQMTKTSFSELQDSEKVGYIWFVKCEDPVHFEVYLGTKKYGETNETVEDLIHEIAEKLKVAIGLTDELTLPDDFQYENILDNLRQFGIRIDALEENAKAIRDTEKVVEELSELPLYPSEENIGHVYLYDNKLYRAKRLPRLLLDFSQIEGHEDQWGNIIVNKTDIVNFINSQGLNIVDENYISIYDNGGEEVYELFKENDSLVFPFGYRLVFQQEENGENTLYFRTAKFEVSAPYNDEENFGGVFIADGDDLSDSHTYSMQKTDLPEEDIPAKHINLLLSNSDIENFPMDYLHIGEEGLTIFSLYSLGIELVRCYSEEDYYNGIFHDFLVWEEVSEEELPIEDTTPATEDTRKRFYREIENNNIYVTDTEYNPGAGGFIIDIVHPKTGGQINNTDELRGYIDPNEVWIDSINGNKQIYADNRYWLNDLGERVTITPIRVGTKSNGGSIFLSTKTDVDLYFSPYISFNSSTQEAVIEQNYTTIEVDDAVAGETNEYEVLLFDNINLLEHKWTIVHVPASTKVYVNTSRRCYLHKIVKKGEGEGNRYYWSQVAKIQDIEDKINALPEVARTGSYTDLFNKPCVGDVQTYDWPNSEDLPIIDNGTGNCDDRTKQLLRWNNRLYTAVQNESGLTLDLREFSRDYKTQGYCGNSLRNFIFQDRIDIVSDAYEDYYVSGKNILIQNTKSRGMQLGSGKDYGNVLLAMRDYGNNKRFLFNEVEVDLQSWSSDGELTTDNANIYIEIGTTSYREENNGGNIEYIQVLTPQKTENIWFKRYSDENVNNPVLKETVKLAGTNCDYIKIWTQYDENPEQYGRRCIVKGITFNNLKYEYDPNPIYNRDIYKKDYWKQINASIKVIDLTGEN